MNSLDETIIRNSELSIVLICFDSEFYLGVLLVTSLMFVVWVTYSIGHYLGRRQVTNDATENQ